MKYVEYAETHESARRCSSGPWNSQYDGTTWQTRGERPFQTY